MVDERSSGRLVLLPDPEPREVIYTIISPDDHLVEPPHMFEGRLPRRLQERAPRVVEDEDGNQVWEFDGRRFAQGASNAVAGLRKERGVAKDPLRFDQMRRGCWDIHHRIKDMDIDGVYASVNFPSSVAGFCGRVFSTASDPELGQATTRAWNDWLFEEWYSPYPDRVIPLGITYITDPEAGAAEIRRNAARGFRSVTLPERPQHIGLPSLHTDHWLPIVEACVETDTVISLHVGSTGSFERPEGSPNDISVAGFPLVSAGACVDWLFSQVPLRYPDVKIVMTEGGIGWVPMLIDRLDSMTDRTGYAQHGHPQRLSDILRRNFWFASIDDVDMFVFREKIGVDHIMIEVDYPHGDGNWPDTQAVTHERIGHLPPEEIRAMCCENASRLFRHPLPPEVKPAVPVQLTAVHGS
jgi:predicted TIM-barrel fold metal-dependent hydrolase